MLHKLKQFQQYFVPEHISGVSETVPCQAPSLAELLRKAAMGVPVHMHDANFDPDEVAQSFKVDPLNCIGVDRVDAEHMRDQLRAEVIEQLKAQQTPAADSPPASSAE